MYTVIVNRAGEKYAAKKTCHSSLNLLFFISRAYLCYVSFANAPRFRYLYGVMRPQDVATSFADKLPNAL